ncbi:MAG: acyl- dehydrogenase [Trebouxia sp. A1-2]|nr:MAG: acyl- dehydrogenase [Trebouxia sp. A1-2]
MVLSTSDAVGAPAKAHALDEADSTQYVLRKKPPGKVLASAHAVEREFQVLAALKDTPVPVPKALCLCQDAAVIGTPFYVMEHGRIFIEPTLPELSPPERAAAYRQQAVTLAALHSVRPEQVNLQRYGRPAGYCARQVWRWSQQYQAQLTGQALPEMMELIDWLKTHIPADDSDPSVGRISHGDYRIDNLIYAPDTTDRVLALLDWELSTLGYPLADLAYSAMCYHFPCSDKTGVRGLPRPLPEGIPTESEYIQMYCQARGIGVPDPTTYAFCQALSMFRIAAILAGVGARAQQGNASSKHAAQVGAPEVVAGIAQRALHVIHEAAQVAHAQSHSPTSRSASNSQGAGSMGGASSAIYSQGPSQGATQGHDSSNSEAAASTPAMPSMSGTSTATSYSDRSDHRSLSGRGESGRVGISSNPTSSQQGSGNMGGGSSAIYSQGPSKGDNGNDTKGDDDTPAMPSMSGTTTASTYSDSKQHPSLSGRGKSSPTSTSASSAYNHPSKGAAQDKIHSSENPEREHKGSAATKGASSENHSASMSQEGKDNMGGASSAVYSQGPRKSGGGAQDGGTKDSQADASTPAMPSMSGTSTATSYSDSSKHRSLTSKGGSSKGGVTSNPTSSFQGSGEGSDNMGGGSSAIYSQGPRQGGGSSSGDSAGDASTPAMPSMSGSSAASIYAQRSGNTALSGSSASSSGHGSSGAQGSSGSSGNSGGSSGNHDRSGSAKAGSEHISATSGNPTKPQGCPLQGFPLRASHAGFSANLGFDPPPRAKARDEGLWNLWLPADMAAKIAHLREKVPEAERHLLIGPGLSNLEYAFLSEVMGRSAIGSEVFNCSAPDTGNMEVLSRYGSRAQQERWLLPLLQGKIRSCFAMTEPQVASSDATNIQSVIRRDGDTYIVSGHKWWTSGAPDPRCKIAIFMGKTDTSATTYKQQSMILVPMDAPGVDVIRPLRVYGYDDAPHGHAEVMFKDVRVPASNMLLGEGRGFEIAQGRLGPGRLHHCMRAVGMGERALELMGKRALDRVAFKKPVAQHGAFQSDYARCRIELSAARLTVLAAAHALDKHGNKKARGQIAAAKVYAPNVVLRVIDAAIQVHGGAGVCDDFPLAALWSGARTLRLADGPDDVHLVSIAKLELAKLSKL